MPSDKPVYDYKPEEVRGALRWQMSKEGTSDAIIKAALESLSDKSIEQAALASAEYNENCQMLALQYREAKRRGQVD